MRTNWVYFLFLVNKTANNKKYTDQLIEQISTVVAACSQRIERRADSDPHNIQRDPRKVWIKSSIKEVFSVFQFNSTSIFLTGAWQIFCSLPSLLSSLHSHDLQTLPDIPGRPPSPRGQQCDHQPLLQLRVAPAPRVHHHAQPRLPASITAAGVQELLCDRPAPVYPASPPSSLHQEYRQG